MSKHAITTGDIIGIGPHRIACGDCRDAALVSRLLGEERTDLIVSDPPYGVNLVASKRGLTGRTRHSTIANDDITNEEAYTTFTREWLEASRPFLAKKNSVYIFASDVMLFAVRRGMEDASYHFAQMLFWIKQAGVLSRLEYLNSHELIFYGWYKSHHPCRRSKQNNVLLYPKTIHNSLHPTMKNVGLLRSLILNSSRIGDLIFDPFAGSGSCGAAAHEIGRRCFMIDCESKYCEVIRTRLEKITGEKSVLLFRSDHGH